MSNPTNKSPKDYFRLVVMVVAYSGFGIMFIFTDMATDYFPLYRTPFGLALMAYAAFRVYSFSKK